MRGGWLILALGAISGCGGGAAEGDAPDGDAVTDGDEDGETGRDAGGDGEEDAISESPADIPPDGEDSPPDATDSDVGDGEAGGDADAEAGDADADAEDGDAWSDCDRDGDRYFAPLCGGDDCDDTRADVHPLALEACSDGVDNDCNGRRDGDDPFCDPGACVPPVPPTVITGDGEFRADWRETTDWSDTFGLWTCMLMGPMVPAHQALFRLTLAEARDVRVEVVDGGPADVALVRGCDPETAVAGECVEYWTAGTFRNVAAGTYLLVAQFEEWTPDAVPSTPDVALTVALSLPTPPPANDRCEAAVDVSAGGSFAGSTLGARVDYEAPMCSSRSFADVAYVFTLSATSDVELVVTPAFNLVVASECGALRMTHRACRRGWASLGALPAGTYYVLVGVQSATADDAGPFTLDVRIRTPAVPLPGNLCPDAVDLAPGASVAGELFGGTNSQETAPIRGSVCLSTINEGDVDVFYRFSLPAPRHLEVRFTGDTLVHSTLFTDCADIRTSTVACNAAPWTGPTSGLRYRDAPAGDYLLRLQTASTSPAPPGPYVLTLVAETPDSTCSAPVGTVSGPGSTELSGTTAASFDDHHGACGTTTAGPDVVYALDLAARSRVTIDASGSTGVAAYLRSDCASASSQLVCADPLAATTLEAGRYWLIVDASPGPYSVWVDRITL
ncbi:MAG: putative metal-binding motif-containing protein [Acidobacteria bacterium]|nr:putative metal-binding motif-containing protein [Acidobacteriota bacterium]